MPLLRNWIDGWRRLRDAARRAFLRDPHVTLFDRVAEPAVGRRESAGEG